MSDISHRQQTLERALDAFDQAHARRQSLRRAGGTVAVVALLVAAAYVVWPHERGANFAPPAVAPIAHRFPSYVEILNDDEDLVNALDASGACEGVVRDGNRVFIVECAQDENLPPA